MPRQTQHRQPIRLFNPTVRKPCDFMQRKLSRPSLCPLNRMVLKYDQSFEKKNGPGYLSTPGMTFHANSCRFSTPLYEVLIFHTKEFHSLLSMIRSGAWPHRGRLAVLKEVRALRPIHPATHFTPTHANLQRHHARPLGRCTFFTLYVTINCIASYGETCPKSRTGRRLYPTSPLAPRRAIFQRQHATSYEFIQKVSRRRYECCGNSHRPAEGGCCSGRNIDHDGTQHHLHADPDESSTLLYGGQATSCGQCAVLSLHVANNCMPSHGEVIVQKEISTFILSITFHVNPRGYPD